MGFSKLLIAHGNIKVFLCLSTTTEPPVWEPELVSEGVNTVIGP